MNYSSTLDGYIFFEKFIRYYEKNAKAKNLLFKQTTEDKIQDMYFVRKLKKDFMKNLSFQIYFL